MFLSRRSRQVEYLDLVERSLDELAAAYGELERINRLFKFGHVFTYTLLPWLGEERCRRLEILDVGAGDGSLGKCLTDWAKSKNWEWNFTNVDLSAQALSLSKQGKNVVGSALDLPFPDRSFDLVVASQMTHHLGDDANIALHFREAWRVTRDGILLTDLHRNIGLYGMVLIGTLLTRMSPEMRSDGLISVKRSFRRKEWLDLAIQAGISEPKVWLYFGSRLVLQARKGA